MTIQLFEQISLNVGITALVLYMLFIMYDLTKNAGAGGYGMLIIFLTLGLGVGSFFVKSIIQFVVQV